MNVVLATDGSLTSQFAVELLARTPIPRSATIRCASVFSPVASVTATAHPILGGLLADQIAQAVEDAKTAAEDAAKSAVANCAAAGFEATEHLLEGDVSSEIVAFAEAQRAELVVIGSHGHGLLEDLLVGNVTRAVVNSAKQSVLVARQKAFALESGLRAVFATDLTEMSFAASRKLASLFEGELDSLEIIGVESDEMRIEAAGATGTATADSVPAAIEERIRALQFELASVAKSLSTSMLKGDVRRAIIDHATDENADLLIVGARSKNVLQRLLLGSVSHYAVTRATCSVLVLRP
jgi:nucleotide-binding universal stress UspA family protein